MTAKHILALLTLFASLLFLNGCTFMDTMVCGGGGYGSSDACKRLNQSRYDDAVTEREELKKENEKDFGCKEKYFESKVVGQSNGVNYIFVNECSWKKEYANETLWLITSARFFNNSKNMQLCKFNYGLKKGQKAWKGHGSTSEFYIYAKGSRDIEIDFNSKAPYSQLTCQFK